MAFDWIDQKRGVRFHDSSGKPATRGIGEVKLASRGADTLRARGERLRPHRPVSSARHISASKRPAQSSFPWYWVALLLLSCCVAPVIFWVGFISRPSSSPASESSSSLNEVTFGSVVKLMHERTHYRLHSHDIPYGSGSGQQSVTSFSGVADSNSYWVVRDATNSSLLQGSTILQGAVVRLQHMRTRKWLHSHVHQSPISGNLEVSCFGGEEESDSGDLWILEIDGKDSVWTMDQRVRLQHINTGAYLHSHDKKFARIAGGQQEVCCVKKKTADNVWVAAEGVYLLFGQK